MKITRRNMESELQSLVPKAPADRVLNRIAQELGPTRRKTLWEAWMPRAAMALAVAASIAVIVMRWPKPAEDPVRSSPTPIAARHVETRLPTMLAYQSALGKSPDDFRNLLDRHAAILLVAASPAHDIGSLYRELLPNEGIENHQ